MKINSVVILETRKFLLAENINNANILIALSGGADSVALATALSALREEFSISLFAFHLNHSLRGAEADRDENFAAEIADKLLIPFTSVKVDVNALALKQGVSTEEAGRNARYEYLEKRAKEIENCFIATAHNLNDSFETFMLNLSRGTGIAGLTGIPARRGEIIRPIRNVSRGEIEEFLKEQEIDFIIDSSNNSEDYRRNIIRHNIAPVFERLSKNYLSSFRNTMENLESTKEFKAAEIAQYLEVYKEDAYSVERLGKLSENMRREIIREKIINFGLQYDKKRIMLLNDIVLKKQGKVNLSGEYYGKIKEGFLLVEREVEIEPPPKFCLEINGEGSYITPEKTIKIKCSNFVQNFDNKSSIDTGKIMGRIKLRYRENGDVIKLKNRHSKTVKKLMNEMKIPVDRRDRLLVMQDEESVLWVEEVGVSERVVPSNDTQNIFLIENKGEI